MLPENSGKSTLCRLSAALQPLALPLSNWRHHPDVYSCYTPRCELKDPHNYYTPRCELKDSRDIIELIWYTGWRKCWTSSLSWYIFVNGVVHLSQEWNFGKATILPLPATPPSPLTATPEVISPLMWCHAFNTPTYKIIATCIKCATMLQANINLRYIMHKYKAGEGCLASHDWSTDVCLLPWG